MYLVKSVLTGNSKEKGLQVKRMLPMTPHVLLLIKCPLNLSQVDDMMFWAACLVGFFGLLRKSNLFPPSLGEFSSSKHLCRSSFHRVPNGYDIHILWSKTIQRRERVLIVPLVAIPGHPLCPVAALDWALFHTTGAALAGAKNCLYHLHPHPPATCVLLRFTTF
jgi:hypothetical protein